MAYYSIPILFAADGGVATLTPGQIAIGVEGVAVPTPSASLRRNSGYCFTSKSENTDLTPFFGRPRIAVGLPGHLMFEASYLPPIRVADAEPSLLSIALAYRVPKSFRGIQLSARAHLTNGRVRGPITCPASALQQTDNSEPCYGTTESNDTFKPNMAGGELIGRTTLSSRFAVGAGIGVTALRPRFQVGFTGTGFVDNTNIETNLTRVTAFADATAHVWRGCTVSAQLFSSPGDLTTGRMLAGCLVRR